MESSPDKNLNGFWQRNFSEIDFDMEGETITLTI